MLISVVTIVIMVLNISVCAVDLNETEDNGYHDSGKTIMTSQEYRAAQSYLIDKWCNGDITYGEFQEQSQAVTDEYLILNTDPVGGTVNSVALNTANTFNAVSNKIASAVSKWGDGARDRVADWWNGVTNNVPTKTTQTSTSDLDGYGAMIYEYITGSDGSTSVQRLPCDYIVVKCNADGEIIEYKYCTNDGRVLWKQMINSDGKWFSYAGFNSPSYFISLSSDRTYKFLGDVRYEDGTPAPSDDDFVTSTVKDFGKLTDKDLEDLLNDMSDEMERKNPDLSSLEGLLNAIYARMGTLDSDDDNELLSSINANILALLQADKENNTNNEELLKALLEIRDGLKNGTLGTSPEAHGHEISGTVYNVIPLDKNWLNKIFHNKANLKVSYEGTTYYLEDCGCLKIGDKYYTPNMNYDSYAIADYDFNNGDIELDSGYLGFSADNPLNLYNNLSFTQRKKIDNIVNSIYQMVTYSIPYAAITSAFAPFEVIIFNTAVPKDIIFNFDGFEVSTGVSGIGSFSVVFLSTDFFLNPYVASAMGIVKPLLTVIIGYCWLKVMRRKVVSM